MVFEDNVEGRRALYNYLLGILRFGYPAIKETIRGHQKDLLNWRLSRETYRAIKNSVYEDNDYITIFSEKSPEQIPLNQLLQEFANYIYCLIAQDAMYQRVALLPMFTYIRDFFREQKFSDIKITVEMEKNADDSELELSTSLSELTSLSEIEGEGDSEIEQDFLQLLQEYRAGLTKSLRANKQLGNEYKWVRDHFKFKEQEEQLKTYNPDADSQSVTTIRSQASDGGLSEMTEQVDDVVGVPPGKYSDYSAIASWKREGARPRKEPPSLDIKTPPQSQEPVVTPAMKLLKAFSKEYIQWWQVLAEVFVLDYQQVVALFNSLPDRLKFEHTMQIYSYGERMRQYIGQEIDASKTSLTLDAMKNRYFNMINRMTKLESGSNLMFIKLLHGICSNIIEAKKVEFTELDQEMSEQLNAWQQLILDSDTAHSDFLNYFIQAQKSVINNEDRRVFEEKAGLSSNPLRAMSISTGIETATIMSEQISTIYIFYKTLSAKKTQDRRSLTPLRSIDPSCFRQTKATIMILLKSFVVELDKNKNSYASFVPQNQDITAPKIIKEIVDQIDRFKIVSTQNKLADEIDSVFFTHQVSADGVFSGRKLGMNVSIALRSLMYWQIKVMSWLYPNDVLLDKMLRSLSLHDQYTNLSGCWTKWEKTVDAVFFNQGSDEGKMSILQEKVHSDSLQITFNFCVNVKKIIYHPDEENLENFYKKIDTTCHEPAQMPPQFSMFSDHPQQAGPATPLITKEDEESSSKWCCCWL